MLLGYTTPVADPQLEPRLHRILDAGPAAIDERLAQLDREWSAGRAAKVLVAGLVLTGLGLALAVDPLWLLLPIAGGACMSQYLFGRSCWVGTLMTSLGFRPGAAIDTEKVALRTLRGDFRHLPTVHDVVDADAISRLEGEGGPAVDDDRPKVDPRDAVHDVLAAAG